MGRADPRPARQEVRHRHVLARGHQRAARRLGLSRRYYLSPGAFIAAEGRSRSTARRRCCATSGSASRRIRRTPTGLDKSFRRSAQIKRYATLSDALGAGHDEVDAVFGDKVQLWLWSQKPEGKCCELIGQDIKDTQTLGIGVSAGMRREDIKLRDAFNKALGEMMSDGTYKKINEKYFPFPLN